MSTPVAIGIDIGGTRVRMGLIDASGEVLAHVEDRLPADGAREPLSALLTDQGARVRREVQAAPQAVGVAMPGIWDPDTTVMQKAVHLPQLEGVNLRELFEQALKLPLVLEADVNAGIWGQWQALDPRPRRLLYISIGTGVGGGMLIDGEIMRHTRGGAGHFGFLIVDTRPGAPGGRNNVPGCLSAIVGGPALHEAATGSPDPQAIGDESLPDDVLQHATRALAIGLLNLVHMYAPDVILLGGGVVDHHPELVEHARTEFFKSRSALIPDGLWIDIAPLSTHEAGVIGAAMIALMRGNPTNT